jgi:ADP-ribose pyrophosphatase
VAPGDRHLAEERIDGERVFDGKLLDVRRDRVRLPDGTTATREYVVHPGAVLVVPVLADGTLVSVRQFRYPLNRVFVEFPAGKLDPGETPLATGQRELREEAGYEARRWSRLGTVHTVVSYSTEAIEIFLAEDLVHVGARLDAGEFLDVVPVAREALLAALDRGEITDVKTVAALLMLERHRAARSTAADTVALRLIVRGRVQGVGFREAMCRYASAARVSGWVRNTREGDVEAFVQGRASAVDSIVEWCRRGPPAGRVLSVEAIEDDPDPACAEFVRKPTYER